MAALRKLNPRTFVRLKIENPGKVASSEPSYLINPETPQLRQTPRHFNHIGGLVSLAAKRHRREERTIGFDQQLFEGTCAAIDRRSFAFKVTIPEKKSESRTQ